jgi:hypothetical protein
MKPAPCKTTADKYETRRIYSLTCADCKKAYIGQTGPFSIHHIYKIHIKNNKDVSRYVTDILNNIQQYRKMEYIKGKNRPNKKCQLMNIKQNFYICTHEPYNQLIEKQKSE